MRRKTVLLIKSLPHASIEAQTVSSSTLPSSAAAQATQLLIEHTHTCALPSLTELLPKAALSVDAPLDECVQWAGALHDWYSVYVGLSHRTESLLSLVPPCEQKVRMLDNMSCTWLHLTRRLFASFALVSIPLSGVRTQ
jgi:hypothetical protein